MKQAEKPIKSDMHASSKINAPKRPLRISNLTHITPFVNKKKETEKVSFLINDGLPLVRHILDAAVLRQVNNVSVSF